MGIMAIRAEVENRRADLLHINCDFGYLIYSFSIQTLETYAPGNELGNQEVNHENMILALMSFGATYYIIL